MRGTQVMMLAAGLGTRLWPLTADRGKPAVPFLGRPLIRGMLDWLVGHGFDRVVVNTHHRPSSIRAALADAPAGVDLRFSHEETILGTAGALAQARDAGLLAPDRTTLVVNAKLVTGIDLRAAGAAHRRSGASVTMVLRPNRARGAFTTVRVRGDQILGFGPPRVPEGPEPLLFTGIHLLEPEVLARAEDRFSDTVRDLYPPEIAAGRVRAVIDEAPWHELSTRRRYLELQLDAAPGRVVLGPGATIDPGADAEDVVLWAGARIAAGARVRRAVLGDDVVLGPGVRCQDVVVVRAERAIDPPQDAPPVRREGALVFVPLGGPASGGPA